MAIFYIKLMMESYRSSKALKFHFKQFKIAFVLAPLVLLPLPALRIALSLSLYILFLFSLLLLLTIFHFLPSFQQCYFEFNILTHSTSTYDQSFSAKAPSLSLREEMLRSVLF